MRNINELPEDLRGIALAVDAIRREEAQQRRHADAATVRADAAMMHASQMEDAIDRELARRERVAAEPISP